MIESKILIGYEVGTVLTLRIRPQHFLSPMSSGVSGNKWRD